MSRLVTVRYVMPTTYTKTLDLDALADDQPAAPVDDLDELAGWLERNHSRSIEASLDMNCEVWDVDGGDIEVDDIQEVDR